MTFFKCLAAEVKRKFKFLGGGFDAQDMGGMGGGFPGFGGFSQGGSSGRSKKSAGPKQNYSFKFG